MNAKRSSLVMVTMMLAHVALAGCATGPFARHRQHHPSVADAQSPAPDSGPGLADKRMTMDMAARCQAHRDMRGARTQEARREMMEQLMKGMSPDMMQKHMDMMQEKCK